MGRSQKYARTRISTESLRAGARRHTTSGIVGLIFVMMLGGSAGAASFTTSAPGLHGVSPFGGSMGEDPESRTGKKEGDLRILESDVRPVTTRKLVHLAERSDAADPPSWRLALVRALAHHERRLNDQEELRLDVIRAIVLLFAPSEATARDQLDPNGTAGAQRHLVRGTAAMALAHSGHPLALKKLLAVALSPDQTDPVGTGLALQALHILDANALHAAELSRLFSPEAIESVLEADSERVELDPKEIAVDDLVKWGAASADSSSQPKETRDQALGKPHPDYLEALKALRQLPHLPRRLSRVREWDSAFARNPTWTLRTWAFLEGRLEKPVLAWGTKKAQQLVTSKSKVERSAAAWSLSVIAPDSATALLKKNDEVITHAILRQASEGRMAELVFAELEQGTLSGENETLAWKMVLQAPELWSAISTARLRRLEKDFSPAVLAPLASRLRTAPLGLGPDAAAVRGWLEDKSPEVRANAALGLAHARSATSQGMLYQAYRNESIPRVRRAIVSSILQTPLGSRPTFTELLALDPDTTSRQLVDTHTESPDRGLFAGTSARTVAKVYDREGRIFEVPPAPDGFIGIVRSSF